jgi:hypothetical protein
LAQVIPSTFQFIVSIYSYLLSAETFINDRGCDIHQPTVFINIS